MEPLPLLLNVWLEPATVLNSTAAPPLPLIWPALVRTLSPGPLRTTPGPPEPPICPLLPMVAGLVTLIPRTPWMIAPELLLICPPPPSTTASPPPTLSGAPDSIQHIDRHVGAAGLRSDPARHGVGLVAVASDR